MRIANDTMEKLLVRTGVMPEGDQLDTLKAEADKLNLSLQELVTQRSLMDEKTVTKAFSDYTKIPYVELDPNTLSAETMKKIPERVARQYHAVLFNIDPDGTNHLAMDDPDDIVAINFLEKQIGTNTKVYIATTDNILECLEMYRGDVNKELNNVIDIQREDEAKVVKPEDQNIDEDSPIAKTVNLLLEYAIRSHASDVHIEPRENYVQIRYRIDGVLHEVNHLPKNVQGALISRIKVLSNLKIDERRVPQDGRFKITVGGRRFALRVSTLPIAEGEKIVMRVLDESNQALTLDQLGYWGAAMRAVTSAMSVSNGMILVTGPTGSGKSTSLFSMLSALNNPGVNISTIEDPVEYKIAGVNQTQTNPKAGMTFANGLRALLRQDPNIIMVGEIRDGETASLAVQAALTGHLVLSTLHTNDAATSLPRLLDMGIEPFLIASTVRITVGQRLVRRLRNQSRTSYQPSETEVRTIMQSFGLSFDTDMPLIQRLEKQAYDDGIGKDIPLSCDGTTIRQLWHADKNDNENGATEGYEGRVGIYEVLDSTPAIQKLITANATSEQIANQAIKDGMVPMAIDGLIKSLRGITTVEEVIRVTKI